ncbi:trypsin-7-like isoform X2 [Leguminivora glycinivorella]|uniref:trypsin-7-like isoform X2 n=1 Tax=Leguminivora glycinivorella TaxID=1035111 RepID=UPI00200C8A04|nr:trypsin-7-like isoform X2 [Leguminivora glycinivorella]
MWTPIWLCMLSVIELCLYGSNAQSGYVCKPGDLLGNCTVKDGLVRGVLSSGCVAHYFRLYVTRRVPPRNYLYFHEVLQGEEDRSFSPLIAPKFRIVGGKSIDIKDAPYQVLYGEYCGGTLIAPEWVLTAAHCREKETFVLVGSTFRSLAVRYNICAHFTHPLWTMNNKLHPHDWDFQLVLLEKPVPTTPMSRPIAIGRLTDVVPGAMVAVSGWGHTTYKKSAMQDHLRRVHVPIIPDEICKILPNVNYHNITDRMFCAGFLNGTKDSCQGDSGGPVIYNGKLIGLVSFGVGCALPDQPGVYSRIPYVRDWIREVTGLPL